MGSPFYSLLPLEPFLPLNIGNLDQNVMCWRGGSLFLLGPFCCPYRPRGNKALGAQGRQRVQCGFGEQDADMSRVAITDDRREQGQREPAR